MNVRFAFIADGMVWGSFPLLAGLFYGEHTLRLEGTAHTLMQITILLIVFGWAYIWNIQGEYARIRQLTVRDLSPTRVKARLNPDIYTKGKTPAASPTLAEKAISPLDIDIPSKKGFEDIHYVSNN